MPNCESSWKISPHLECCETVEETGALPIARRTIKDCRAIVTGASSGIGRELSLELARQGARLVVTARREDRLQELCDEIRQLGGEAWPVAGDITDSEHRQRVVDEVQDRYGGLDALVNNAGISAIGMFADARADRLRQIMEVNFFSAVEMTRLALPLLRKGIRPIIVNVSSVLGHRALPKKTEYCASKFALHGFSDSLRAELVKEKIDVLLVCPGSTSTELFDVVIEKTEELNWERWSKMPAKKVAQKTVRAMRKGKQEIIMSKMGKFIVCLDRAIPRLANRWIAKFGG